MMLRPGFVLQKKRFKYTSDYSLYFSTKSGLEESGINIGKVYIHDSFEFNEEGD